LKIATPYIEGYLNARANAAVGEEGKAKPKTQPEIEFELSPYESTFDDFDEMAVQYGFVSLFVVCFPLAPLAAMANNIIEIRLDATKITNFCRRPEPEGAMNIGTWFDILSIVSYISVITNSLLCVFRIGIISQRCFCTKPFPDWDNLLGHNRIKLLESLSKSVLVLFCIRNQRHSFITEVKVTLSGTFLEKILIVLFFLAINKTVNQMLLTSKMGPYTLWFIINKVGHEELKQQN